MDTIAVRSQCYVTESSLLGKCLVNFTTGGEALSPRLLGLQGSHTEEDTGLVLASPFRW